jgi:molybdenum cofactor guanylyltransferase
VSVVGFVVAGGQSLRMGRDKALLPWEKTDLLGHAIARLRRVTGDVRILCGPSPRYEDRGVPVVVDRLADAGPIAGIVAGLEQSGGRPGLFLAVDLPLVPVALLEHLARLGGSWDAVVPLSPRGAEPLCAVYAPACLGPILGRVGAGEMRMTSFWPEVRVLELGPSDLSAFGHADGCFRNVNTPAEFADASRATSAARGASRRRRSLKGR